MSHEFDVQRRSPYTPEGQIEQAGHLSRGVVRRMGRERIGLVFLVGAVVCAVGAIALAVT